ncbi:MAG: hypothetical protein FGO69_10945 [Methanobacterium sp.]|nr:MAG: hypothetical protein FGO69_10945 [Methanobacterium sp.]
MVKIKASMIIEGNEVSLEISEVEANRKSIKTVSNLLFDILFEKEDDEEVVMEKEEEQHMMFQ